MSTEPILDQPRSGDACRLCGKHLGLYVVRGDYHSLCAPCTKERIESCAPRPDERPSWAAILYDEVLHEIRYREHREKQRYTVSWDLEKCSACGRMIKRCDARYVDRTAIRVNPSDSDKSEEVPARILGPARRLRDGTVLFSPASGAPQILHPVCHPCYDNH